MNLKRRFLYSLLVLAVLVTHPSSGASGQEGTPDDSLPAAGGEQDKPKVNQCATCHTEPALWDESNKRLFISPEMLKGDVHCQKGVACYECHGGDPTSMNFATAHIGLVPVAKVADHCATCHHDQALSVLKSVHAKAGDKNEQGRGTPLSCLKCHGTKTHGLLPVSDQGSPVNSDNQVRTCGGCHEEYQKSYEATVHGTGLNDSGLIVTAVCADCHGAHGIYYAADRRSKLHITNVASTCSECHKFIQERLAESVHGKLEGPGQATEHPASGGKTKRHPACSDCHQGHELAKASSGDFRLRLTSSCGNCHSDLYSRYAQSMHGELTHKGYSAAAECADCHGAHDILPVDNPDSRVAAGANRLRTCQKCHVYAVSNFTKFDPHANFKDAVGSPWLHSIYEWIQFIVNGMFLLFLLHASIWFIRAFVDRLRHGGHVTLEPEQYAMPRFGAMFRATYVVLMAAFIGLLATALALKYSDQQWLQGLVNSLGGFRTIKDWHHFFAVIALTVGFIHLVGGFFRLKDGHSEQSWKSTILGPDSLVPNGRDLRDFGKMLLWFVGFGKKPGFERWAYWEKLDYWAFGLAALFIASSGLMLWYPNLFCLVFPGGILNVAKMVHSEFAIYVASVLFLIHFFHAHFRPEKFPLDQSVMTGLVSEQHLRKYRPDYIARLEREGRLEELRREAPSTKNRWLIILGGVVVFTLGLCLLVVALLASLAQ